MIQIVCFCSQKNQWRIQTRIKQLTSGNGSRRLAFLTWKPVRSCSACLFPGNVGNSGVWGRWSNYTQTLNIPPLGKGKTKRNYLTLQCTGLEVVQSSNGPGWRGNWDAFRSGFRRLEEFFPRGLGFESIVLQESSMQEPKSFAEMFYHCFTFDFFFHQFETALENK